MAFGIFAGGLVNGFASGLIKEREARLRMEMAQRAVQEPTIKMVCEYCGRCGGGDQCISCGAPLVVMPAKTTKQLWMENILALHRAGMMPDKDLAQAILPAEYYKIGDITQSGHIYNRGEMHNCGEPDCPANYPNENRI